MDLALRAFILVDGKINRIGIKRLSRALYENAMPEYAGQEIPYVLLVFEREGRKLGNLLHYEGRLFVAKTPNSWEIMSLKLVSGQIKYDINPIHDTNIPIPKYLFPFPIQFGS